MSEYSPKKSTPEARKAHLVRAAGIEADFTEALGEKVGKQMGEFARGATSAAHRALEETLPIARAFARRNARNKNPEA